MIPFTMLDIENMNGIQAMLEWWEVQNVFCNLIEEMDYVRDL